MALIFFSQLWRTQFHSVQTHHHCQPLERFLPVQKNISFWWCSLILSIPSHLGLSHLACRRRRFIHPHPLNALSSYNAYPTSHYFPLHIHFYIHSTSTHTQPYYTHMVVLVNVKNYYTQICIYICIYLHRSSNSGPGYTRPCTHAKMKNILKFLKKGYGWG